MFSIKKRWNESKISSKLKVSFSIIIGMLVIVGVFSFVGMNSIIDQSDKVSHAKEIMIHFKQKEIDHLNWMSAVQKGLAYRSAQEINVQEDAHKCAFGKWYYSEQRGKVEELFPKTKKYLEAIEEPHRVLHNSVSGIKKNLFQGHLQGALQVFDSETTVNLKKIQGLLADITREIVSDSKKIETKTQNATWQTKILIVFIALFGIIIAIFLGVFIVRELSRKLKGFMDLFFKGASGDLTSRYNLKSVNCSEFMQCGKRDCPDFGKNEVLCFFDVGSMAPSFGKEIHCPKILKGVYATCKECPVYHMIAPDEITELAAWYNKFMINIHDMVADIIASSENLAEAVEQIAGGNENLSQRTTEQASSLEEIASSIEEASATINQNADSAEDANKLASKTLKLAEEGNKVVNEAVQAINEISEASNKIRNIISAIDEIASKTDLLALNAAIEAARAGEQGRGFAVVAREVQSLSQRTGGEAKNIDELIQDSLKKIEKGTELSNKSGEALKEIVESVKRFSNLMNEIATASQEQKQGMEQINVSVADMDTMTQQNAALVEETASAGEEMAKQAENLIDMTKNFTVSKK